MSAERKIIRFPKLLNLAVAMMVIAAILSIPASVSSPLPFFAICIAGYMSFLVVSMTAKNRILVSILASVVWLFCTLIVAAIVVLIVHPIGPCF
jgi:hypothetical protein